ncbi:unnamed protein product [Closterium sp. Naga37s-1]|nr:unnamed protein product [Closterium sp. Naga37s-1]
MPLYLCPSSVGNRGRAPGGDKTDWVMHEYRLTEDAAGGAVSGRNSSRDDEDTNLDTTGPGEVGGAADGGLARSSDSSLKARSPEHQTGKARKIDVASWVVVRVVKRSSLTTEEQATVTHQLMAAQQAMVAQQRMAEQQMGGPPLQGANPRLLVHPRGSGAELQAGATGGDRNAGWASGAGGASGSGGAVNPGMRNIEQRHESGVRGMAGEGLMVVPEGNHATGTGVGVTLTVRSNSPSTDSQGDNSPNTLTARESPNSSFSAMPVDVRSSDTASQAAGSDTGAAKGGLVAAMASVAMDVAGGGAAVGAAVGTGNLSTHPTPAFPLLRLPTSQTRLSHSSYIQAGSFETPQNTAGSSIRPAVQQGLQTPQISMPLLQHLLLLQQQQSSNATVQQGLFHQQQQISYSAMQQGFLPQQHQHNMPAAQQEFEQVLFHDPSFRQLLFQAESSEPPASRDGDPLIQVEAEAEPFGLWEVMQQGMRTGEDQMVVPEGLTVPERMTIPPTPGATVLTPANPLLPLPPTHTHIQLLSLPLTRATPNQQAGFTVTSQQQQGHSAPQQRGYQQAIAAPFSSWSAPPHPFRPTPSASMSASSSGESRPRATASVAAAAGASTHPVGAADSAEPGDTEAGQTNQQEEMQQLADLLRSILGNPEPSRGKDARAHIVNVGYPEQQQQQQHDQYSLHEILQPHMSQQQELSPDPPRPRSASCPAVPLQGANHHVTPFRTTHSYNHPGSLQGAVGVQGEQGRTEMETQSDSLLHTSVWGRGGTEMAGRGMRERGGVERTGGKVAWKRLSAMSAGMEEQGALGWSREKRTCQEGWELQQQG